MSKKLIHKYTFDASAQTVTLDGIYGQDRLLMITNITDNIIIYLFNSPELGLTNYSIDTVAETTTLSLVYDTTLMADTDSLQIFTESDSQTFKPDKTYTDPVSKFRVSQPENLIDTDFEYGLQSTKWETLELTKNIPTFYARNGDQEITLTDVTTFAGSSTITVTTGTPHGLQRGSPVILVGTSISTADGGFLVQSVPDTTTFTYQAKATQSVATSILETYTQLFPGSIYSGTEFKLANVGGITTNGSTPSTLTVNTQYPTNFTAGTSMALANTFAQSTIPFLTNNIEPDNYIEIDQSYTSATATGENSGFALGGVNWINIIPQNTIGRNTIYFEEGSLDVDTSGNTIRFDTPHGFVNLDSIIYMCDAGTNTPIGGITVMRGYYVTVVDTYTIQLRLTRSVSGTIVSLTSNGVSGGITKSCFVIGIGQGVTSHTASNGRATYYADHGFSTTTASNRYFAIRDNDNVSIPTLTDTTSIALTNDGTYDYWAARTAATSHTARNTSSSAVIALTDTTADYHVMHVSNSRPSGSSSLYLPSHGLSTDDIVNLTATAGTLPAALTSGNYYRVVKVSDDRISFKDIAGADILFADGGSTDLQYRITAILPISTSDTITIANNQLNDGDAIIYSETGGTTIGGLTDGVTYYVARKSGDTFSLSTTPNVINSTLTLANQTATYVDTTNSYIIGQTHGFTTGQAVEYVAATPIPGLRSGEVYFARSVTSTSFSLHPTAAEATSNTNKTILYAVSTGTSLFNGLNLVDITSAPSGETQNFIANFIGAADGIYEVVSTAGDQLSFTLSSNNTVTPRNITGTCQELFAPTVDGFFYENHGLLTGTPVVYTETGTVNITGLTDSTTYYVIKASKDIFKLATTQANALNGIAISLTDSAVSADQDGTLTFTGTSIVGSFVASGTITYAASATTIYGQDTAFTSYFNAGDTFSINIPPASTTTALSAASGGSEYFATATAHGLTDGMMIRFTGTTPLTDVDFDKNYFVNCSVTGAATTRFAVYYSETDALADSNKINITSGTITGASVISVPDSGSVVQRTIDFVNSDTQLTVTEALPATAQSNISYFLNTGLLLRSDGFALHRPYDGGVELIPSSNPDSSMIRQTRKYFRYQSGKGIQVSFAVNFSPTSGIDTFTRSGTTGTITTRFPHRLTVGLDIITSGATNAEASIWNGSHEVTALVDDYTFEVELSSAPSDAFAQGIIEYYVDRWINSSLRCGLFDDQNGIYFEYDGQDIYACRKSSTLQLGGYATVEFRSGIVTGTSTKWNSQLSVGDMIVIKGQSYQITRIDSDTRMYISPSYRGVSTDKVILTKTLVTKVVQEDWNDDVCDGTGPSGYVLDINKIQMVYIDYSWYGAGKVRFGFKDQYGDVMYVHEFIHNNKQTEAYMRSGNLPARYEIQNYGAPSYVPALAHWGTSVIMDGRFDPDKAYTFNASSNNITVTGAASITASAKIDYLNIYTQRVGRNNLSIGYGLLLDAADANLAAVTSGVGISGAGLAANTSARNPISTSVTPYQPYLPSVLSREGTDFTTQEVRNLIVLDKQPSATAGTSSTYTFAVSGGITTDLTVAIPLISIRLSPSVDTGTPGFLGEREIINRMQLILQQVGVLTTHAIEVRLVLNGQVSSDAWQRVTNPSLSQLIIHSSNDSITGGASVFKFRAAGGTGTEDRSQNLTIQELGEVATLGNSILGGDGTFPDGPDVLTVVAVLTEDPSTVSSTNPYIVSGRISWSESQA